MLISPCEILWVPTIYLCLERGKQREFIIADFFCLGLAALVNLPINLTILSLPFLSIFNVHH